MGFAQLEEEPTALELKFITGKGKWRCTVPVSIIQQYLRDFRDIQVHLLAAFHMKRVILRILFDGIERIGKLRPR